MRKINKANEIIVVIPILLRATIFLKYFPPAKTKLEKRTITKLMRLEKFSMKKLITPMINISKANM